MFELRTVLVTSVSSKSHTEQDQPCLARTSYRRPSSIMELIFLAPLAHAAPSRKHGAPRPLQTGPMSLRTQAVSSSVLPAVRTICFLLVSIKP
jgi:hypothetical protein